VTKYKEKNVCLFLCCQKTVSDINYSSIRFRVFLALALIQSNMTHNVTKLPQVKDNKSHVKHILLYMCQICLTICFDTWCAKYASSEGQQRIIVKHILHNMCQMWLCAGARFTVCLPVARERLRLLRQSVWVSLFAYNKKCHYTVYCTGN
jgi:hypothetical protein